MNEWNERLERVKTHFIYLDKQICKNLKIGINSLFRFRRNYYSKNSGVYRCIVQFILDHEKKMNNSDFFSLDKFQGNEVKIEKEKSPNQLSIIEEKIDMLQEQIKILSNILRERK